MTTSHAPSYYAASANDSPPRPPLAGAHEADVCIIGAGYTGLSSGLFLAEAGFRVVVLEAARVGWGASGRNGGQIVHSYSRDMDVIEARHGADAARALGGMAFEGARIIRERVAKYGIQCDLKGGGIYAAKTRRKVRDLEHHKGLWERYGNDQLELLDRGGVHRHIGSDAYEAILVDRSGGHIHPLNLALGEAAALESLGGTICEASKVLRIERGERPVVHTGGGQVRARYVIVACNAYIGDLEPQLAAKSMPCGTQVVATEPLGERWKEVLPTDHCVEDNNFLLDYYRLSADRRLIFGGGVIYGARDPARIEQLIRPNLEKTFPQLAGVKIDYAWTGNFLLTLSRLPQVGRLDDTIYYSQGCSGHGVTYTHLIGRVLSEALQGQAERFDAFASLPHYPFPGGRMFRIPFTALGAWWYDLRDRLGA
ncbi:NAD(P)/FAD-dependent oxidoreductase [Pseudomarimonas salicorniae]|uniref:FAD-binding oxidoreductase n=1 Tax=Pseudomarimonas salicorniae TaxID=2933270 RepID=A0ABT0GD87_9GAMM|nr:FAD-binding oxidoreductase [Lysobacter sp. CAU 1642]MCK7592393.1 FAD-binding oxidoreductase [Lysobacter sp. CAU 1642]